MKLRRTTNKAKKKTKDASGQTIYELKENCIGSVASRNFNVGEVKGKMASQCEKKCNEG